MKLLLSLFMLLMVSNSCDSSKKAIENSKIMQEPLSGTYYITQLEATDVSAYNISITFDATSNKVNGFAGCNSFLGNYTIKNNTITFGNIASTRKLCHGEASNTESLFLKSLNSVNLVTAIDTSISFLENDNILIKGIKKEVASGRSAIVNYQNNTAVKYQTFSKSTFDYVIISKDKILISKDKALQKIDKYSVNPKDWEALNEMIEAIDAETIKDIVPPSTSYQVDGALHATLSLIKGDVAYTSKGFDHGNPPETLMALVNKVLSIKENTLKE